MNVSNTNGIRCKAKKNNGGIRKQTIIPRCS